MKRLSLIFSIINLEANRFQSISHIFLNKRFIISLYILMALITGIKQYAKGSYNNYKIFTHTFWHSIQQNPLYESYPEQYGDINHYGPVFAVVIAPFAVLPDAIGSSLWNMANALVLCAGIYSLPLSLKNRSLIGLICAHEALTAMFSYQFNVGLTGLILLSFSYIIKQEDIKAAFVIALGTLIKLYGIVGLAFFFFTRRKWKLILAGIISLAFLFILPSVLSSTDFVWKSYEDWYVALSQKNASNASLTSMQDLSVMGFVRRILQDSSIPNYPFLVGGLLLFSLPYVRINQYKYLGFRLMLLASVLIFTVIFSSGSESPTYIIAFAGVAIWFITQNSPKSKFSIGLFIFAFLLTSMSASDLFPRFIRENYVRPYSLKALPCILIWLTIIYQMLTIDFKNHKFSKS